jgi:uroporphyrinogen-III decarboxylase
MPESMTPFERMEAAYRMEQTDRVPVAPISCYLIPYLAGMSIKEMFSEPERMVEAFIEHGDLVGDACDPNLIILDHLYMLGRGGWDQVTLDWHVYDNFPPDGNIPNIYEKAIIEDYDDVQERGFAPILFNQKLENDIAKRSPYEFLNNHFEFPERFAAALRSYVERTGIPILKGARACHPLDLLQYYRGINQLTMDIFEQPEKVHQFCEWVMDYEVVHGMKIAMTMGAGEVPGADTIFFYNGGPPGMSPAIYDEFYWPYAKAMNHAWVNRGFKVWNHWDNDHTPFLETIQHITDGIPKGKIVMDFEKTDMKKAKEVLGGTVTIYGNVPSALCVYGSVDEVDAYCKQLIEDCAEGGGFILGSECEVPWDSKPENIRTIIEAARKYS